MQTERKSSIVMKDLVQMFSKPDEFVLDWLARTHSTAKAGIFHLEKFEKFVGCEK